MNPLPLTHCQYYVYVLKLENDKYYVGATRSLKKRMIAHFTQGGAIATRQSKAVALVRLIKLDNYMIGKGYAHSRLEVIVASRVAKRFGKEYVRGAKHGKGWDSCQSENDLQMVNRYNHWLRTEKGKELRSRTKFCSRAETIRLVNWEIWK